MKKNNSIVDKNILSSILNKYNKTISGDKILLHLLQRVQIATTTIKYNFTIELRLTRTVSGIYITKQSSLSE